jgi:transcriptional regulator with XRE-family HTH domain
MNDVPVVEMQETPPVRTLRQWRRRRGMSQQSLAALCGHSVSTLSTIERGANRVPEVATMRDVARVLGVDKMHIREFRDAINRED